MTLSVTSPKLRGTGSVLAISAVALVLAGCSSMGSFGRDPMVTSATTQSGGAVVGQAMPAFVPPANIGGGAIASGNYPAIIDRTTASVPGMPASGSQSAVVTQDLPALQPSVTSTPAMPAPNAVAATTAPALSQPAPGAAPQLGVVQGDTYRHTIASGESLYTIARRYDVSATDVIAANNITAPDKIVVGQSLIIPGRPDLLAQRNQQAQQVASTSPSQTLATPSAAPTPPAAPAVSQDVAPAPVAQQPTQTALAPADAAPSASTASTAGDKFRWPLSGRVITDFAASRGTGINIESPEGTSVRAAENGEVIYVGNAVEGYGNLILIKHDNGYVSAYAHLKTIGVAKGDAVARGDAIGTVGMTGSVTRPQLHFELRRGATPVDPMPLLAG